MGWDDCGLTQGNLRMIRLGKIHGHHAWVEADRLKLVIDEKASRW